MSNERIRIVISLPSPLKGFNVGLVAAAVDSPQLPLSDPKGLGSFVCPGAEPLLQSHPDYCLTVMAIPKLLPSQLKHLKLHPLRKTYQS